MSENSGKTLSEKLGLKPGFKIYIESPLKNIYDLLTPFPEEIIFLKKLESTPDMVIYFARKENELFAALEAFKNSISVNGSIWVCWLKQKTGMKQKLNENSIRTIALNSGLVDIKVCAVDEDWSALKLVIRKNKRK